MTSSDAQDKSPSKAPSADSADSGRLIDLSDDQDQTAADSTEAANESAAEKDTTGSPDAAKGSSDDNVALPDLLEPGQQNFADVDSSDEIRTGVLLDYRLPHVQAAARRWITEQQWVNLKQLEHVDDLLKNGVSNDLGEILTEKGFINNEQKQTIDEAIWIGLTLPRFHVVKLLGAGATGSVFMANDKKTMVQVALKIMHREIADSVDNRERFNREAKALAKLSHPVIPALVDHSDDREGDLWTTGHLLDRPPFLAMEYIQGTTLEDLVRKTGPIREAHAVAMALQIASGLQHAVQRSQLVHRDLKPANILAQDLTTDKVASLYREIVPIRIIDFGLAKYEEPNEEEDDAGLTRVGAVLGTPYYMSPEQAEGKETSWQSDLYALGATLFFLLTGRPPYDGKRSSAVMMSHVHDPIPDPRDHARGLSVRTVNLCMKAMEKDPRRRHCSYTDFIEACERAIRHLDPKGELGLLPKLDFWRRGGKPETASYSPSEADQDTTALRPKTGKKQKAGQADDAANPDDPEHDPTLTTTARLAANIKRQVKTRPQQARKKRRIPIRRLNTKRLQRQRDSVRDATTRILRSHPELDDLMPMTPFVLMGICLLCVVVLAVWPY